MYIKEVTLKDFSAFDNADFSFSPGINVFIGANGTGKTHLLKLLYAVCASTPKSAGPGGSVKLERNLESKLTGVFKPDESDLSRLIRGDERDAEIRIRLDLGKVDFNIDMTGGIDVYLPIVKEHIRSLFIPSKEVLSIFPGFSTAYSEKELSFDETYNDICIALGGSRLKSPHKNRISLIAKLESMLEGSVVFTGTNFRIKGKNDKKGTEAHLLSEGMRKVAMIAHLLSTGAIRRGSILFWDEPESSLNPVFITKIAEVIRGLAEMDVQVFIATHDYLLTRELSLEAEYDVKPQFGSRFFCFDRKDFSSPVHVEYGDVLADLKHNPILQEFGAHYEREQELFYARAGKAVKQNGK